MDAELHDEIVEFFLEQQEIDSTSTLWLDLDEFIYATSSFDKWAVKYKGEFYGVSVEWAASDHGDRVDLVHVVWDTDKDDFIQYVLEWGFEEDKELIIKHI